MITDWLIDLALLMLFSMMYHSGVLSPRVLRHCCCFCCPILFLGVFTPNQTKPKQSKLNHTKPNQTKPNLTKSNQTKPNQTKPNQTKPKPNPNPNQTKPSPNPSPDIVRFWHTAQTAQQNIVQGAVIPLSAGTVGVLRGGSMGKMCPSGASTRVCKRVPQGVYPAIQAI